MKQNKIAWKLAGNFTAAILVFAIVVGLCFGHFFRVNTVDTRQQELLRRAVRIAAIMGDSYERQHDRNDNVVTRRLIAYINTLTMDDVWVIDTAGNVEMRNSIRNKEQEVALKHSRTEGSRHVWGFRGKSVTGYIEEYKGPLGRDLPSVLAGIVPLKDVEMGLQKSIRAAFKGDNLVTEWFDEDYKELMVVAIAPIYSQDGGVRSVLVLRTPMIGLRESWLSGLNLLLISCGVALVLAIITSIFFALNFTKPLNKMKQVAEKLAERDYTARSNIVQEDEIGELAKTLDMLSGRLEEADKESRKLDKLRRDFIANVSHELRTPVTVIRGSVEALKDKVVTNPEEVAKYYQTMHGETLFLQRLINDLLDLSRLQNTDFDIEKSPVNLCDVISEAVRSSRQLGMNKNVEITVSDDTKMYMLLGDYGRLRQMLLVFLDNAIKFSREDGLVEIKLLGNKLTITDYGVGISQEDIKHIFDRFYKTRIEANKSGSGLGLAIAKEIAERHQIVPSISSEEGQYTTIELILPEPMTEEQLENAN